MPATIQTVRNLVREFPGVEEGAYFGTPAFYLRRKLILRLWEDGETLVARCPKEKRAALIKKNPDAYFVTEHYRNYPSILVDLLAVSLETLREAIERAWRMTATKKAILDFDAGRKENV